ncbi:MAG: F0F1 ATP synthase subunit A [Paludibacteraceae bacterium]|nr:F0F1 ATP synthase subunit A [Paludibacteraceae bacterium]
MKLLKNKTTRLFTLIFSLLLCSQFSLFAAENVDTTAKEEKKGIDVKELVFGHINDNYSWHITTINGHHISIPLLVIVKGQNGWDVFCASKFHHGEAAYKGYEICKEGDISGRIIETSTGKRPLDISITKNVLSLFISCGLLLWIFLSIAKKYKTNPLQRPKGMQALLEPLIIAFDQDVAKACIGKNYKKFSPYLLTVFFFIFLNNMLGIVPIFPGGANLTGNIAITMVLAVITFLFTNFYGTKEYWKEVFWPEVPTWLKVPVPLMPIIEIIGLFTKPIALMIRLFANMLAGHIMVLVLIGLIFIFSAMSVVVGACVPVLSVALVVFMSLLEILVCFIQAYVFMTLSALFIGLAQVEPHHEK